MSKTVLKTKEVAPDKAVLIIDKTGVIGEALAKEFSKDYYVVFLSGRIISNSNERIRQIIFKGKIPKVPQSRYSIIFLIDDGDSVTRQSSMSFIKEAKKINSDFYFLGSIRNHDIQHSDEIIRIYDKAKILIFGDLFDKRFLFDPDSSITKFIVSASNEKLINVSNDGLSFSFPMSFDDTVKLIIKASYLKIEEKIILLFYKNPITDISLAHIFQKIDPDIKVDFINDKNQKNIFIPDGAEFAISKYDIKNKIENLDLEKKRKIVISKNKKSKSDLKFFKFLAFTLPLLIFVFCLPLITSISYGALGKMQMQKSFDLAQENNFNEALVVIDRANSFFQISKNANEVLNKQLIFLNLDDNFENLMKDTQVNEEILFSVSNLFTGLNYLKNMYDGKSLNPGEDFDNGINFLKKSYLGNQNNKILNNDFDINTTVEFIAATSDILPELIGLNGEKKYLILFQDSNQLTPGGGKISAIGRINLKKGRIVKLDVINTKEFNDASSVRVEPPYFIRRYLKDDNLNLVESNYDPDFVTNAIGVTSLYSLVGNEEVDGVIGVDVYFLKKMLEVEGDVHIKTINKNVNSENVIQVLAENENGDLFTDIVKELIYKNEDKNDNSILNYLGVIGELISEKHLMFAFKDPEAQNLFVKNNFSGSLMENRANTDEKINDFFGISEYNVGLNYINYFISRSIEKKNMINDDGGLESEITVSYKNNSERGSSLAKTYKNYVQLILPFGSVLESISVGGKNQKIFQAVTSPVLYENENFKNIDGIEIEQKREKDKSIFGFVVQIAPDSLEKIKIKYNLPFSLYNPNHSTDYSIVVYKQPGIDSFSFTLSFINSSNFVILPNNYVSKDIKKDEEINFKILEK